MLLCFALALPLAAADAVNMSGVWVLNVKESRWGKKKPPQNVSITIQHQEPKFKYTGELTPTLEGQRETFTFDGAIDGKEYRVKEDNVERKVKISRRSPSAIESTITSLDGRSIETTSTSISSDGKRLTRRITLKAPEGTARWTEVYDKQ